MRHRLSPGACAPLLAWIALTLWGSGAAAQEGYRLLSDQILVDTETHWQAWEAPAGVRVVGQDGVTARFLRRDINAAANAGRFRYVSEGDTLTGGILTAGSNREQAPMVIDGDPDTYWEPDLDQPLDDWWIDIDLGRAVIAKRIVVRFADTGDPFLKFRVLVSDGRVTFTRQRQREFFRVGLANLPNKTQREFVFDIGSQRRVPEGLVGAVTHIVRIQALGTDGPRGSEVDAEAYAGLPAQDRGAVDTFRRTTAGRQIRVEQEIYAALPAAQQGEVRHYRRERPRLAEVEVLSLGDNIVRLTRPPIGPGRLSRELRLTRPFTDGLFSTYGYLRSYDPVRDENQVVIDLGARYWLDRIRLLSPDAPPLAYQLRVSDGSVNPDGELIWRLFDERLNREGFLQMEETFGPRQVRYIDLRGLELVAGSQESGHLVGEIQAYGEGYASAVVMVSPMMQLPRSSLFTTLEWEGEAPLNTRIEVRTRSGDEILRIPHYFTLAGTEIGQVTWERRDPEKRGPVVIEELPGADWSGWSEIYQESGEAFKSASPRRNVLVEVRLLSAEPQRAARIRELRLRFVPPFTDKALAELWPVRVRPGREEEFTLYLRPWFGVGNPGFDRIRLRSSSVAPLELVSVRSGSERLLRLGAGQSLWPGGLQVERGEEGGLDLVFPTPVRQGTLYAIRFRTQVFLGNTQFFIQLLHSALPERVQQVSPGDATELVASQSLVVVADLGKARLLEVAVAPAGLTPNGDGINDEVSIEVTVYAIEGSKRLRVEIFDLGGRRLRDLSLERLHPSGRHHIRWDGRDEGERLVPPGIYVVRVGFATDAGRGGTEVVRLVHVVY